MKKFTLEELKKEMETISKSWHKSIAKGDQGPGRTLENLLGVPENNISLPDYGTIELKTKILKKEDNLSGLTTLFTKEPMPRASIPKVLLSMGWKHWNAGKNYSENEKAFYATITPEEFTNRGMTVEITDEKIFIKFEPKKVKRADKDSSIGNPYPSLGDWLDDIENRKNPHYSEIMPLFYDRKSIEDQFITKLNNTFFCLVRQKKVNDKLSFKYESGYILKGLDKEKVESVYSKGAKFEISARTKHNHGTKLRMNMKNLFNLFETSERIL